MKVITNIECGFFTYMKNLLTTIIQKQQRKIPSPSTEIPGFTYTKYLFYPVCHVESFIHDGSLKRAKL